MKLGLSSVIVKGVRQWRDLKRRNAELEKENAELWNAFITLWERGTELEDEVEALGGAVRPWGALRPTGLRRAGDQ